MASLNDIQLNPQSILKKQFRTKMKGYDSDEVDSYLIRLFLTIVLLRQLLKICRHKLVS